MRLLRCCYLSVSCFKIEDHCRAQYVFYETILFWQVGVLFWSDTPGYLFFYCEDGRDNSTFQYQLYFSNSTLSVCLVGALGQSGCRFGGVGCRWSFSKFFFFRRRNCSRISLFVQKFRHRLIFASFVFRQPSSFSWFGGNLCSTFLQLSTQEWKALQQIRSAMC